MIKAITMIVDFHPLERRSVVKANDLDEREIKSRYRSERLNHCKSICIVSLDFNLLLLTNLLYLEHLLTFLVNFISNMDLLMYL